MLRWTTVILTLILTPLLFLALVAQGETHKNLTEVKGQASCPIGTVVKSIHITTKGDGSGDANWRLTNLEEKSVAAYTHRVEEPRKIGYFVNVRCGAYATNVHTVQTLAMAKMTQSVTPYSSIRIQKLRATLVCDYLPKTTSISKGGYGECTSTSVG